jgi:uncharacterized protein (TIGR02996 family)
MSEKEPFVQEILANPDDDAPRLVFADWLEERGDPDETARAEFIRVQVERSLLAGRDPRRAELAARESALLDAHQDAWLKPLPRWAQPLGSSFFDPDPELRRYPFVRGFVSMVEAEVNAFVVGASELWRVEPVTGLWTSLTDPGAMLRLAASPHLANLTALTLGDGSPIGPAGARGLGDSAYTNRLRRLSLGGQELGDAGVAALAAASHLANLATLLLDENQISAAGVAELLASPRREHLTALGLSRNGLGTAGARALADLRELARLTKLDLGANDLDDDAATALAGSASLRNLTVLDLSGNAIGDAGVAALAASPYLANLRVLALQDNPIGDAGAAALAASPNLARLSTLELWFTQVGDAGALALAASSHLDGLEAIVFYPGPALAIYHLITDIGARALRDRFGDRVRL